MGGGRRAAEVIGRSLNRYCKKGGILLSLLLLKSGRKSKVFKSIQKARVFCHSVVNILIYLLEYQRYARVEYFEYFFSAEQSLNYSKQAGIYIFRYIPLLSGCFEYFFSELVSGVFPMPS